MNKDQFIQKLYPTLPVSVIAPMERLNTPGSRYWIANDGLWIETYRPWLYLLQPVSVANKGTTPFGVIPAPVLELPKLPRSVLTEFVERAHEACPNEIGCWIFLDTEGRHRLVWYDQVGTPDLLQYTRPTPNPGESLVWDIHSHGKEPAYFSSIDDADDFGDTKISMVIGSLNEAEYTLAARLTSREITITLHS